MTAIKPVGFQFENVATNGKILLFTEQLPDDELHVYNVSDKTRIREIATLQDAGDHTMTCILGCKWAYGSDGAIVDLRKPGNPKLMRQDWHKINIVYAVDYTRGIDILATPVPTPTAHTPARTSAAPDEADHSQSARRLEKATGQPASTSAFC